MNETHEVIGEEVIGLTEKENWKEVFAVSGWSITAHWNNTRGGGVRHAVLMKFDDNFEKADHIFTYRDFPFVTDAYRLTMVLREDGEISRTRFENMAEFA